MANVKAALSHQEVFFNKKIFSNKIHTRVLKVRVEISKALGDLKIINDEDKQLFLNAVNHYYQDLTAVIFHVRQIVIKIDENEQVLRDLQNIIAELNKIVLRVQESLNLETEQLIIQLKDTLVDVGFQVENLMKIIECDNLHDHKHKVLECQHDLVISAEGLKFYCQLSYLSLPELEKLVHEAIEKIKNNLIKIKTGHELLAEDFLRYTHHSVKYFQNAVNYMRKMINLENFDTDMKNGFKIADGFAIQFISGFLESASHDNPMGKMLESIEKIHNNVIEGSVALQKGFQASIGKNISKKDNEKAKQIIIHLFINGMNALSALNQSIEDAIMKK